MSHLFKESQQKAANKVVEAALKLDAAEARRAILAQAKACGAELDEALSICLNFDDARGFKDLLDVWGDEASVSRQLVLRAAVSRSVDCFRIIVERGEPLSAKPERPALAAAEISVWASAARLPNYGSHPQDAAELLSLLAQIPLEGQCQPWEAHLALSLVAKDVESFSIEKPSSAEGALSLARARFARAMLKGGVELDPLPQGAADIPKSATLRVLALCLRGLLAEGELREACAKLARQIDWKGLNAQAQPLGGLFSLLAERMCPPCRGFKGQQAQSALAQARALEELTGERGHRRPGVFASAFASSRRMGQPFVMADPRAELIMSLLGQDQAPLSAEDLCWIIESSVEGIEAFKKKVDAQGEGAQRPEFGRNLYALFGHLNRLGVSSGERARDEALLQSAPALINELCNEHDSIMKSKAYAADASILDAFAEKTRLCAASLMASVESPTPSAPRRSPSL